MTSVPIRFNKGGGGVASVPIRFNKGGGGVASLLISFNNGGLGMASVSRRYNKGRKTYVTPGFSGYSKRGMVYVPVRSDDGRCGFKRHF